MSERKQSYHPSILVIDDDMPVRDVMVRLLRRAGLRATGACDGLTGVRAAERTRPDLILLDLCMDGVDGRITHRLLRSQVPATVILAFTGLLISDEPLLYEGFDGVIRKPVLSFELVEQVTRALDNAWARRGRDSRPAGLLAVA
jgi:CheY-like chemotaxis protein